MVNSAIIQENVLGFLADGEPRSVQEIKAYLTSVSIVDYSERKFAGSLLTLQRNGKIMKLDRGVYSLGQNKAEDKIMKTCFFVSPIGNENSDIRKNADQLLKYIIEPACHNFIVERVDQMNDAGSITQTILDSLENADLVIADITGHNPNVFYEMGFRRRTGKPIIHLKRKGESIPFDVSAIRTSEYDLADLDSVESVKNRLTKIVESFSFETEDNQLKGVKDSMTQSTLPILYEILDSIEVLRNEVTNNK
ncbi:MAG: hypothetical protein FWE34_05510 [Defluviitaleaceae bacterium]|nr:hypothetical protein [Defluviitaleaceae bacterium]